VQLDGEGVILLCNRHEREYAQYHYIRFLLSVAVETRHGLWHGGVSKVRGTYNPIH